MLLLVAGGRAAVATRPVAWGCQRVVPDTGACVVPEGLAGASAISAATSHNLALKSDGSVVAWGCAVPNINVGQCTVFGGLTGVTAIAAASFHSLARKGDGTVVAWGCGFPTNSNQCSVPPGLSDVTAIAAAAYHSLALKSDGTVVAWGCGPIQNVGQCNIPVGLTGVTAVAAGFGSSLALKSDRTVVGWGCMFGNYGQCSVPPGLSDVTAIAAAAYHSLALKSDGTVVAWGCNGSVGVNYGQCNVPGGLSDVTAISAGQTHSLALKRDGSVVGWGCDPASFGQCSPPPALCHATAIAAGFFQSLALAQLCQTISFAPLADRAYGEPDFSITATTSAGLPVSLAAAGNCALTGELIHITGVGSCTVSASQAGNDNYNAAPNVSRTFAITKGSQTISFSPLRNRRFPAPDFRLRASASSGLPVAFMRRGKCVIRNATVHLTGVGSCTVTAVQAGNENYKPAPPVSRRFLITWAHCTVPRLVGKRLAAARRTLARGHCRTGKVRHAYSSRRARGIVVSQNRRPGRVLPANSKIGLVVSRGPRP